jgi:hypothetical protein
MFSYKISRPTGPKLLLLGGARSRSRSLMLKGKALMTSSSWLLGRFGRNAIDSCTIGRLSCQLLFNNVIFLNNQCQFGQVFPGVYCVFPATLIYCTDRHHVGLLLQFHTLPTLFYIRVIDSLRFIYIHKYFWVREYIATRGNQKEQERRVLLVLASHGVVVFWKHGILIPPPAVATGTAVCWSS